MVTILLVAAALLFGFLIRGCSSIFDTDAGDGKSDSTKIIEGRIAARDTVYLRVRDTILARVAQNTGVVRRLEAAATAARETADSLKLVADSAMTAADSATNYRLALVSRTVERDSLQTALGVEQQISADNLMRATMAEERVTLRDENIRLLNVDLAAAVKKQRCTIPGTFGQVRCLSKKESFGAGLLAGAYGGYRATRR